MAPELFGGKVSCPQYRACFKTYGFRMRVKADTYNDETRLKHSVVDASDLEYASYCKRLIQVELVSSFVGLALHARRSRMLASRTFQFQTR